MPTASGQTDRGRGGVGDVEKKIAAEVCQEAEQEIGKMVNRVIAGRRRIEGLDLEATENGLRAMGQRVGCGLLEKLLNAGRRIARTDVVCGKGHRARFKGSRTKQLVTVVGALKLERGYHYCGECC